MSYLDKDLKKIGRIETAVGERARALAPSGVALVFLLAVALFSLTVAGNEPLSVYVVFATIIAGYMALNMGANDVANNMAPAVGSKALTLTMALIIAAVCEASGAILAGGDVVDTISRGIITPSPDLDTHRFVLLMIAALLAASLWINLATILHAPVSTTHAIVGAVLGAGVMAFGFSSVSWPVMGGIAASWVISPVLGALIAAGMLAFIKSAILFQRDRVTAARRWAPLLLAFMVGVFTLYMLTKGLSRVWRPPAALIWPAAGAAFLLAWLGARRWVMARSEGMENSRKQVGTLFIPPLIFSAALLSFAHGANDVSNAVGPLAAIVEAVRGGEGGAGGAVTLPLWVLLVGGIGIALGLALFGPRLIRTVGEKITRMDPVRAFCVALSAGVTVLAASALGLPVSSTHIAIGGIFGVGLLREVMTNNGFRRRGAEPSVNLNQTSRKALKEQAKRRKRMLVRRRHLWGIAAAWVITVPLAGLLAALIYLALIHFIP